MNNWSINNESFNIISNKYGPYSADRFANNLNKKVNKFNSHVNAFTDDWSGYYNWLCSSISCIGSVLRHLILCKSKGALFVPTWPSFYHWPLIYTDWDQMANFATQNIVIEPFILEKSVNRSLIVIDRGIYAQRGYWESRILFLTC